MGEPITVRRKRLIHQSRYRGRLEADLLLGGFANRHIGRLDPAQLDRYEALLGEPDADILGWISGRVPAPPEHDHDVLDLLRSFRLVEAHG